MLKFDESITVNGSVEAVFDFVADPLNIPKYEAEVLGIRLIGDPPVRVGSKFEETMRIAFATKVFDCTVVDLEPAKRVAFTASGSALACRVDFIVTPGPNGVQLRMHGSGELKGMWKL